MRFLSSLGLLKERLAYERSEGMKLYQPRCLVEPPVMLAVESAWKGLELIIQDIVDRFDLDGDKCIEFGVEFGYSTVALSNYFRRVTGVDLFVGDIHTVHKGLHFDETRASLSRYENIEL